MNKRVRILIHHKKYQNQKSKKPLGVTQFFSRFIFVFALSLILILFKIPPLPPLWPHGLSSVLFCALFSPLCYLIFSTQFCTWKFCMWWNCDTVTVLNQNQLRSSAQGRRSQLFMVPLQIHGTENPLAGQGGRVFSCIWGYQGPGLKGRRLD